MSGNTYGAPPTVRPSGVHRTHPAFSRGGLAAVSVGRTLLVIRATVPPTLRRRPRQRAQPGSLDSAGAAGAGERRTAMWRVIGIIALIWVGLMVIGALFKFLVWVLVIGALLFVGSAVYRAIKNSN